VTLVVCSIVVVSSVVVAITSYRNISTRCEINVRSLLIIVINIIIKNNVVKIKVIYCQFASECVSDIV